MKRQVFKQHFKPSQTSLFGFTLYRDSSITLGSHMCFFILDSFEHLLKWNKVYISGKKHLTTNHLKTTLNVSLSAQWRLETKSLTFN